MPRPPFKPTDEQRKTVKAMAGYGIRQEEIALVLSIDPKTLRKAFRLELDTGKTIATSKVAEALYQNALSGNVSAQIFWMKAQAGWSEKVRIADADGDKLDFSALMGVVQGRSQVSPDEDQPRTTH
jgi:hypothetical protein